MTGTDWSLGWAVCQPEHRWEGHSGPWSESSPQPLVSEEPGGSSLPCKDLGYMAGTRRELGGQALWWRGSARPHHRVKLLCEGFFPLQRKEQKY